MEVVYCIRRDSSLYFSRLEGHRPSISSRCPCFPSRRIPVGIVRGPPPLRLAPARRGLGPSRDPGAFSQGARLSEAVPQGTEGLTEGSAPQLSPEHQRGGRDVGALPPAAVGRRLPGRAVCAGRGSGLQLGPKCDYSYDFSDHQDSSDVGDDSNAGHHSSTRYLCKPQQLYFLF